SNNGVRSFLLTNPFRKPQNVPCLKTPVQHPERAVPTPAIFDKSFVLNSDALKRKHQVSRMTITSKLKKEAPESFPFTTPISCKVTSHIHEEKNS
ncbi:hypothetical protein MXB_800, partial [Myxobolus squamalis]